MRSHLPIAPAAQLPAVMMPAVLVLAVLVIAPALSRAQDLPEQDFQQQQLFGGQGESSDGDPNFEADTSVWTWPMAGSTTTERQDIVYQAFPHDGAVFSNPSVVTLGWQPLAVGDLTPRRYEVYVSSDFGQQNLTLAPGWNEEGKPTCVLFQPEGPGRYFWQVWAYFEDGRGTASPGRTFTVLP